MEIIEIMTPELTGCANFVVNNAVDSVVLNTPAAPSIMYSGNNGHKFTNGDNFLILSAGYYIPERFTIYGHQSVDPNKSCTPQMLLRVNEDPAGFSFVVDQFGNDGALNIPFPNYEFSIGTFIEIEQFSLSTPLFNIAVDFPNSIDPDKPLISMIDVPAALNGKTFYVIPFIKILHNIPL